MKNKVLLIAGSVSLLSLWSQASFAVCTLEDKNFIAQNVIMDIGKITLDPKKKVGEIYKTGSFKINERKNVFSCDKRGGAAIGVVIPGTKVANMENTYSTNVRGIGIRLYRDSGPIQTYYPHRIPLSAGSYGRLAGGNFKVDIIKTENVTGTGGNPP